MPLREDLGTARLDPPLARVTLAARQLEPAWQHKVAPGPDGQQRHLPAMWELAVEAQGVQADLRIPFPRPLVIRGGGSNLPKGWDLVGMFACQLVSGHWRVQTGVAGIGEEGTVTTAGIVLLAVITGWEKRKADWADVVWLAMRVHVQRIRSNGGGVDVTAVEGEEDAPPPPAPRGGRSGKPPPPPASRHR